MLTVAAASSLHSEWMNVYTASTGTLDCQEEEASGSKWWNDTKSWPRQRNLALQCLHAHGRGEKIKKYVNPGSFKKKSEKEWKGKMQDIPKPPVQNFTHSHLVTRGIRDCNYMFWPLENWPQSLMLKGLVTSWSLFWLPGILTVAEKHEWHAVTNHLSATYMKVLQIDTCKLLSSTSRVVFLNFRQSWPAVSSYRMSDGIDLLISLLARKRIIIFHEMSNYSC